MSSDHSHDMFYAFAHEHEMNTKQPHQNHPMQHAFIVMGERTVFLCHQIMGFMEGHNYELILEVEFTDPAVIRKIVADRANGNTHFLANRKQDRHTLPEIKSGRVKTLHADVWNKFPEPLMPPWLAFKPFIENVTVRILRVVHYRHVDLNIARKRFESYLLFGKDDEAHLSHCVVAQPDYDHVLSVNEVPTWIQPAQLEAGVEISFPRLKWNAKETIKENPLSEGQEHEVLYFGIRHYRAQEPDHSQTPPSWDPDVRIPVPTLRVTAGRTFWLSTRVFNFFGDDQPSPDVKEVPTPSLVPSPRSS